MVFVFGSNRAGIHGAGAALFAARFHGAVRGTGEGRMGNCYAIPTKEKPFDPGLPLEEIREGIRRFIAYARENSHETFLLTPVGCGLAGHKKSDLWKILRKEGLPNNVVLASSWIND